MKTNGTGGIERALQNLARKGLPCKVEVGYGTEYAVYVHEDMEANHPNGGQAKYLEQPARAMRKALGDQVRRDMNSGLTLKEAQLRAGLKLQAASQNLVPVDTGDLKASAYTKVIK
jgi:L-alanine-DL-glutamate epimerase-like enolase superfamily enzyme